MSPGPARAGDLVAEGLRQQSPEVRGLFLRDVLAHAVAGLTVLEGASAAGRQSTGWPMRWRQGGGHEGAGLEGADWGQRG